MSEPSPEAAALLSQVNQQIAALEEQAAAAARMRAEAAGVRGRATSPQREVSVEVDGLGRVQDISFGQGALALSPADLGRVVIAAIRSACAEAERAVLAVTEPVLGPSVERDEFRRAYAPRPPAGGSPIPRTGIVHPPGTR